MNPILLLTTNLTVGTQQNRDDAIKGIQEIFENQVSKVCRIEQYNNYSELHSKLFI